MPNGKREDDRVVFQSLGTRQADAKMTIFSFFTGRNSKRKTTHKAHVHQRDLKDKVTKVYGDDMEHSSELRQSSAQVNQAQDAKSTRGL